jgi:hypothetical protein
MSGSLAQDGGGTIQFLTVLTDTGMMEDEPIVESEELTTPGVDGRRWRTVFKQYPQFQLYATSDAATYDAAIELKRKAARFVQSLGTLKMTLDTVTYQAKKVHIDGVIATCVPGPATGAGAAGLAHVVFVWKLTLTEFI